MMTEGGRKEAGRRQDGCRSVGAKSHEQAQAQGGGGGLTFPAYRSRGADGNGPRRGPALPGQRPRTFQSAASDGETSQQRPSHTAAHVEVCLVGGSVLCIA
jgi:hypothetical protein